MEKGKGLLYILITKRVVPRCVYTEMQTQKFHLLDIFCLGYVEKIHTCVSSLDWQVRGGSGEF